MLIDLDIQPLSFGQEGVGNQQTFDYAFECWATDVEVEHAGCCRLPSHTTSIPKEPVKDSRGPAVELDARRFVCDLT